MPSVNNHLPSFPVEVILLLGFELLRVDSVFPDVDINVFVPVSGDTLQTKNCLAFENQ